MNLYFVKFKIVSFSFQALDSAIKQYKSLSPQTAVMFFSIDEDAGKILCMASVPKVSLLLRDLS